MPGGCPARRHTIARHTLHGLLLCLLLAGCLPPNGNETAAWPLAPGGSWEEAWCALDPADADPPYDLTAVYLRLQDEDIEIRIDLLAYPSADDLSLDIEIGDEANPQAAPLFIHLPASADSARFALDPELATVTVTLPRSQVPAHSRIEVTTPQDALTVPRPAAYPQRGCPHTASVLLTFYDTFASRFPAEALRSWDAAHSGPRGERHGLKHLLEAAETAQIPLVLLDLKTPENLSALDAMGLLPRIRRMEEDGLLLLPNPPHPGALFDLQHSPFSYGEIQADAPTFAVSSDASHLYRPLFSDTSIIPIAIQSGQNQPTPNGPSLEVRRALLETALNEERNDLLILGGSLRRSTWGHPEMAGKMLAWLASRPYVHILTADDLLEFPAKPGWPALRPLPRDEANAQLASHYQSLTEPVLHFTEHWQGAPLSTCTDDLDQDGEAECVLANEDYLAIFDARGARLTYLFTLTQSETAPQLHQLIGPSWQVAVGLSNPSQWDLSKGEAADPGAYPGAFTDLGDAFEVYLPTLRGDTLTFTSPDSQRAKTFRLTPAGLEVTYHGPETVKTQISLLVEPETRFTPAWAGKYVQEVSPGQVTWGLGNGPMLRIQAQGQITIRAFSESLPFLTGPEDPDFSYPAGHYLPFPMAVVEVTLAPDTPVWVSVSHEYMVTFQLSTWRRNIRLRWW